MFVAPLEGWRRAEITEQRTRKDWAEQVKRLVDEDFPLTEKIILVMDNLNTHSVASLYETFPAEEAKRLRDKLEIHYTSKHGSWLNMAEIELNVIKQPRIIGADTGHRADEERGGGVEQETKQRSV
jgi:transposase